MYNIFNLTCSYNYDTEEFIAKRECCACREELDMTHFCYNDNSVADSDGDTCKVMYSSVENLEYCGNYDTQEFKSSEACCWCGGGEF